MNLINKIRLQKKVSCYSLMQKKQGQFRNIAARKHKQFFLIKNSHANPIFINHDYFSSRNKQYIKDKLDQRSLNRKKEYVDAPTPFGIDNTYMFLLKNSLHQLPEKITTHERFHTQTGNYLRKTLLGSIRQKMNKKSLNLPEMKLMKTQVTNLDFRLHRSSGAYFQLLFLYGKNIVEYKDLGFKIMKVDIGPYILRCFRKCKINFEHITSQQFTIIVRMILQVLPTKKGRFSPKDVINLHSIKSLLSHLKSLEQDSQEWRQTVRYFFMPQKNILEYHLKALNDQLKSRAILKFNAVFHEQEVISFRLQDGHKMQSLYEFLYRGKFVFDTSVEGYNNVKKIIKEHKDTQLIKNRINKWKNIIPTDPQQVQDRDQAFVTMSNEKYDQIYKTQQKKRYKNRMNRNKKNYAERPESFMNKADLMKHEDIFQ